MCTHVKRINNGSNPELDFELQKESWIISFYGKDAVSFPLNSGFLKKKNYLFSFLKNN